MAIEKADERRLQMINAQLRTSDVNELEILSAFTDVPREKFVAPGLEALAYADGEVAASGPKGRKLLSPRTLGLLLKCVAPVAGERALVVGGGSGYCAALLAALGLDVVALETDASAARAATAGIARIEHAEGALTEPPAGQGAFRRNCHQRRLRDHARSPDRRLVRKGPPRRPQRRDRGEANRVVRALGRRNQRDGALRCGRRRAARFRPRAGVRFLIRNWGDTAVRCRKFATPRLIFC